MTEVELVELIFIMIFFHGFCLRHCHLLNNWKFYIEVVHLYFIYFIRITRLKFAKF